MPNMNFHQPDPNTDMIKNYDKKLKTATSFE